MRAQRSAGPIAHAGVAPAWIGLGMSIEQTFQPPIALCLAVTFHISLSLSRRIGCFSSAGTSPGRNAEVTRMVSVMVAVCGYKPSEAEAAGKTPPPAGAPTGR